MKKIKTTQMQKLISATASSLVDQLMPEVVCYDPTGLLAKKLRRELTWLEEVGSVSELNSYEEGVLKILHGPSKEINEAIQNIDVIGLYIFCFTDDSHYEIEAYPNSLALKLANPDVEQVIFHLKALLIAAESTEFYNQNYPIYACDKHRLLELIEYIYNRQTVCVGIDSLDAAEVWHDYLFKELPAKLHPEKRDSLDTSTSTARRKYSFVATDNLASLRTESNCIVFTTSTYSGGEVPHINFKRNRTDTDAEYIKHYLAAMAASLKLRDISYYWGSHQNLSFLELYNTLSKNNSNKNVHTEMPAKLAEFLDENNTLSLPDFMDELEYQVLTLLKLKTERIKGTVLASGIREGTLHKKMERHLVKRHDKENK